MSNPEEMDKHSVDFLLAEYSAASRNLSESEDVGDKRVTFFLTLTTSFIGALGIVSRFGHGPIGSQTNMLLFFGLGALLLYGVVTFMRIIHRNLTSDNYKQKLNTIRRYFAERDIEITHYLPFDPFEPIPPRKEKWNKWYSLGTGGLIQTVALLNSLIVGLLSSIILGRFLPPVLISVSDLIVVSFGVAFSFIGWCLQYKYVIMRYREKKKEIETSLVVWSDNPELISKNICARSSVGNYQLISQPTEIICDNYFDTTNGLFGKDWSLRIREVNEKWLITLKGPSKPSKVGSIRLESEADYYEPDDMKQIIDDLEEFKKLLKNKGDNKFEIEVKDLKLKKDLEVLQKIIKVLESDQEQIKNLKRGERAGHNLMYMILYQLLKIVDLWLFNNVTRLEKSEM